LHEETSIYLIIPVPVAVPSNATEISPFRYHILLQLDRMQFHLQKNSFEMHMNFERMSLVEMVSPEPVYNSQEEKKDKIQIIFS